MKMKMPGGVGQGGQALQAALAKQMEASQAAQKKAEENKAAATGSTEQPQQNTPVQGQPQAGQKVPIDPKNIPPHIMRQLQMQHANRNRPPPPTWFIGDDRHRSITIYPIYINSLKTVAGGRRVPKEFCVPRPHVREMFLVLKHAGFQCIMVPKCHPRDTFKGDPNNLGRLHILFKNQDGTPVNPEVAKTKTELLKYIGGKIPLLKTRQPGHQEMPDDDELTNNNAPAKPQQATPAKSNAKSKNKRKKRR